MGKQLQKEKSAEYWRQLEGQLPTWTRERILKVTVLLQQRVDRGKLQEKVATGYIHYLIRTAVLVHGNLDDVQAVATALKDSQFKGQLRNFIAAYNWYRQAHGIKEELDIHRDRRRPLPILTPETTLQASLAVPTQLRWLGYFRLRYETGARPSEPFHMQKQHINFDQQLVRLGTLKGSGDTLERELPISPLCTEQLRTLTAGKLPEEYVFTKPLIPNKPLDYKDAQDVMKRIREQLQKAGYNVQGLTLYIYRHAFATRLYHATKDLALVSRSMGHRNIETTMLYIHLHPDQPRRYDVVNCPTGDKDTITKQIGEGWELALQTPLEIFFKRPRWVP